MVTHAGPPCNTAPSLQLLKYTFRFLILFAVFWEKCKGKWVIKEWDLLGREDHGECLPLISLYTHPNKTIYEPHT